MRVTTIRRVKRVGRKWVKVNEYRCIASIPEGPLSYGKLNYLIQFWNVFGKNIAGLPDLTLAQRLTEKK